MAEYTPTTAEVRATYITGTPTHIGLTRAGDEFDRWLAVHDREVAASALEGAAARLSVPVVTEVQLRARAVIDVELLFEADRIRSGTEAETGDKR